MWSTCKSLQQLVIDVVENGKETVKKSSREPISLPYVHQKVVLSQDFTDEVLLLSDLFDANELMMVELLLTAESQLPSYRNISRGFLAVLLYFESHFAIVDALRLIIQSREGRSWSTSLSGEAVQIIQKFTCDLWECGLLQNVISKYLLIISNSWEHHLSTYRYNVWSNVHMKLSITTGILDISPAF
ncbi:unnamed protein product [Echinostoma caproni]|uniref:Nuclear pore complex protein n=1 Tax=Echinostoma caproni TaxID=27848 RepID=A0A183AHI9_9TREM|nr:unnamed protein product [Echinostoma caproni]